MESSNGKPNKKARVKTAKPHKTPPPHSVSKGKAKPERHISLSPTRESSKVVEPNEDDDDGAASNPGDDDNVSNPSAMPVSSPSMPTESSSSKGQGGDGGGEGEGDGGEGGGDDEYSSTESGGGIVNADDDASLSSSSAKELMILYTSIAIVVVLASCYYCVRNFSICNTSMGSGISRATTLYSPVVMTDNETREMELSRFNRMAANNANAYPAPTVP